MAKKPIFIDEVQDRKVKDIASLQKKTKKAVNEDAIDYYYAHLIQSNHLFKNFIQKEFPIYADMILNEVSDAPLKVFEDILALPRERINFERIVLPHDKDRVLHLAPKNTLGLYLIIKTKKEDGKQVQKIIEDIREKFHDKDGQIKVGIVLKQDEQMPKENNIEILAFISEKITGEKDDGKKDKV